MNILLGGRRTSDDLIVGGRGLWTKVANTRQRPLRPCDLIPWAPAGEMSGVCLDMILPRGRRRAGAVVTVRHCVFECVLSSLCGVCVWILCHGETTAVGQADGYGREASCDRLWLRQRRCTAD